MLGLALPLLAVACLVAGLAMDGWLNAAAGILLFVVGFIAGSDTC